MSHPPPDASTLSAPRALFQAARVAAGGEAWNGLRALRLEGTISAGRLSGPYEQTLSLDPPRYVNRYTLGPASLAKGFDGGTAWHRGASGEVVAQTTQAAREAAVAEAYLHARTFLFAERDTARIEPLDVHIDDTGRQLIGLRVLPPGGQDIALWFDAATHLLVRSEQALYGQLNAKRYEQHESIGGITLPLRVVSGHGEPRHDVVVEISRVTLNPRLSDDAFSAPTQALDDLQFSHGTEHVTVPIDVLNHHVYLSATVNGHPMRFLLDTGGVNLLTPEAAARAGLQTEGALEARGPGERSVEVSFARVDELQVGDGLRLQGQLMRVLSLQGLSEYEGTPIDGLLGHELFQRLVIEIDYAGGQATFASPRVFRAPGDAQPLPLRFHAHFPAVHATLDGVDGEFWLDTGNRNAVTLYKPFADAHPQIVGDSLGDETTIGYGIGGAVRGRVGQARALQLGALTVERPTLTLPSRNDGVTATRKVAGNIGGALLREFVVTFDYPQARVFLQRRDESRDPDR